MVKRVLYIAGLVTTLGLLGMTVPTTVQLMKIDHGLSTSLSATSKLVAVQSSIIEKNTHLKSVIDTANDMSKHLQVTRTTTDAIEQNIAKIDALNYQTLLLNRAMTQSAAQSGTSLRAISSEMSSLHEATNALAQTLQTLKQSLMQDAANLSAMEQDVRGMNAKTPGVTGG